MFVSPGPSGLSVKNGFSIRMILWLDVCFTRISLDSQQRMNFMRKGMKANTFRKLL